MGTLVWWWKKYLSVNMENRIFFKWSWNKKKMWNMDVTSNKRWKIESWFHCAWFQVTSLFVIESVPVACVAWRFRSFILKIWTIILAIHPKINTEWLLNNRHTPILEWRRENLSFCLFFYKYRNRREERCERIEEKNSKFIPHFRQHTILKRLTSIAR